MSAASPEVAVMAIEEGADTGSEIVEAQARSSLVINPAKVCQPIGAAFAALGIHKAMPHSHGSQGCSAYLRMHLARHFHEPIPTTGSSFTEGTAVFGGGPNLRQSVLNVAHIYKPDVMAIHTTCSTETIGDDVPAIVENLKLDGEFPEGLIALHANTPSYVGNHVTGWARMVESMVESFSGKEAELRAAGASALQGVPESPRQAGSYVNVIPGWVDPSDVREVKRILALLGIEAVVFPDVSGVLDAPITGELNMYPSGGTTVSDLCATGQATATFALGHEASLTSATHLEKRMEVPAVSLGQPIGVRQTDALVEALVAHTGGSVPQELADERGRLVDLMVDSHTHFHGKRVAVFGDADVTLGLASLCAELGMEVVIVLTGSRDQAWESSVKEALSVDSLGVSAPAVGGRVMPGSDLYTLEQVIKAEIGEGRPIDLLLGNTYGRYMAREFDIPFVRAGWPVMDRSGGHLMPIVGYAGSIRLVRDFDSALLDRVDRDTPLERFELVM